jgi:hypothetical protein
LNLDLFDPNGREGLAMALALVVPFPPFHFEDDDLLRPALVKDFSHHLDVGQIGGTDPYPLPFGIVKNLREFDLIAFLTQDLFHPEGIPGRDLVLFTPRLNDGVHGKPPLANVSV